MSNYLRYPHLAADLITFVAADDVWLAPVAGGRAWRLSSHGVPVRSPRLAPDAGSVAWVSTHQSQADVWWLDLDGSTAPQRLTWWGCAGTQLLGWHLDDSGEPRLLVASEAGQANLRHRVVRSIGTDGSERPLPFGPAGGLAWRPDGAVVLSTLASRPPAWWKRYRGGTAPRLWLDADGSGGWRRLLAEEEAGLVDPMWLGEELLFVSDRAARLPGAATEQANLWRWATPGQGEPQLLTHQDESQGYVRDATTDGTRVVWHSRGTVRVLDDLAAEPRELEVTLPGSRPTAFRAKPTDQLELVQPDHTGTASLVGWRGTVHWLVHRDGAARALAAEPGVRVREPVLLGRSGQVAVVSDHAGEDTLRVLTTDGSAAPRDLATGLGRVLHLAADPAGERLAAVSHDGVVRVVGVADGSVAEVATSRQGEPLTPVFSPDGRYLVWSEPTTGEGELHRLLLLEVGRGEPPQPLTAGRFHDSSPTFSPDGRHLLFLSRRTFDPAYDDHAFSLGFTASTRVWVLPLAADEPAPFGPRLAGRSATPASGSQLDKAEHDQARAGSAEAGTPPRSPDVDLTGAEQRMVALPVAAGRLEQLRSSDDGVLWIRKAEETAQLGSRRAGVAGEPVGDALEGWSWSEHRQQRLVEGVEDYRVSGDGTRLVVRQGEEVTVRPTAKPVKDEDEELVKLDLGRLHLQIEPSAEWGQMFAENARLMRDHYWRADLDGQDWDAVTTRWAGLLPRLASHDDLVDLLWETVGELNTSHAYVMPPPRPDQERFAVGRLGADLVRTEQGWRIERILPGETSEPGARSPLLTAGVDAREGDLVVAVAGRPVDPGLGVGPALVGTADQPVELTLERAGERRRVVVVPLADEEQLRYQDWVDSRRRYVSERSGGRLGYLHVPDMMALGWAQLHRDLRRAVRHEGVVLDVRYNRGGHTSQLVLGRLTTPVAAWNTGRHLADPMTYPSAAPRGPVVLVANEHSGSDGDIVNAAAQTLGLGPVVGVRTWGGVVGIDGRFSLVDGTGVTQPRYAFWMQGKGWGVENHGVDPDIEVVHTPGDFFAPADPQLDRAVEEALSRLEQHPAAVPPTPDPARGPGGGGGSSVR